MHDRIPLGHQSPHQVVTVHERVVELGHRPTVRPVVTSCGAPWNVMACVGGEVDPTTRPIVTVAIIVVLLLVVLRPLSRQQKFKNLYFSPPL